MAGGKVWVAPLISMVAERRGRSWRTTLRMARPVRFWVSRATARAVNTGQVRFDRVSGPVEHGSGGQVGLADPEGLLHVPQVVVAADHLGRWHEGGGDVGDVPLQACQAPGAGQGGLVQGAGAGGGRDESGGAGGLRAGDDVAGTVLLGGERGVVAHEAFAGERPHGPPRGSNQWPRHHVRSTTTAG